MKNTGYSIKDLEVLSGIKAHTIRIWEKRYSLLHPQRTDTNIRYYTDSDMRKMLNVSLLVKNGYKISKVARWNEKELKETVIELTGRAESVNEYSERLLLHLLNLDNTEFYSLVNEVIGKFGLEEAVSKVFFELFNRVGRYWQAGAVFPAQEHYVTNIIRQKIIAETDKLNPVKVKKTTILFFLPENELHEIGLLYYAYLTKKAGHQIVYLGQFVPLNDLKKIAGQIKIDYVFTAFSNAIEKHDLEQYLVRLKQVFEKQKVFVTGYQIQNHQPKLPRNFKTVKNRREFQKYIS